jgi:hypothetical protein
LRFPEDDGGSGGGLPLDEDNFGPRRLDDERALRELLSNADIATREEVVDAVYALGNIERVSLIAFDMGDEPLVALRKRTHERSPVENRTPIVVNKPATNLAIQEDTGWGPLAIGSALAGGGTLWVGGTWWWLGRARRRSANQLIAEL